MCAGLMRTGGIVVAVIAAVTLSAGRTVVQGQTPPAAPNAAALPDIVGFRPGMSLQEAYSLLKAYNPKLQIQAGEALVPEISDKKLPYVLVLSEDGSNSGALGERIVLDITFPPGKQVVWKVSRLVNFLQGKEPTRENLMAALRNKYGQEFPPDGQSEGGAMLAWFFDGRGQRAAETSGLSYANCRSALGGADYQANVGQIVLSIPPPSPYARPYSVEKLPAAFRPCRSVVVVNAGLNASIEPKLVRQMGVAVADVGLRFRAQQATYDHIASVQAAQKKQELGKAQQQPTPKL